MNGGGPSAPTQEIDVTKSTTERIWDRFEEAFLVEMQGCIGQSDFTEYGGCRQTGETRVACRSRVYEGEKLDRVTVTRYTLKRDHRGLLIFGYPRVEYDIPSFLLHLGGSPPERMLAILDLAPASEATNMAPFGELSDTQRAALNLPDSIVEWLRPVTSPHLLHCAFKPLDPERFLATVKATVRLWRTAYIEPAERLGNGPSSKARGDAVLRLKEVLYRNNPGFRIFAKSFGQAMTDVLAEAEFGGTPALNIQAAAEPPPGSWINKKLGVSWSADAQEKVLEAPFFIRGMIRRTIEKEAVKDGVNVVSVELVNRCEQQYRRGKQA